MSQPLTRNQLLLLGIDAITQKVLYQTRWMQRKGFSVTAFTTVRDTTTVRADPSVEIIPIRKGAAARLKQIVRFLRENRSTLHHVELYVAGRFAFVYALTCRIFRIPVLVVERGDLLFCQKRVYPWTMRVSIYTCYVVATRIWLRELYMIRFFQRWRMSSKIFLLANAVPAFSATTSTEKRTTDFLFLNRLIPERHPARLVDVLLELQREHPITAEIVGILPGPQAYGTQQEQDRVEEKASRATGWLSLHPFGNPAVFYERSRFFVLPADVVFANFALLEAMAAGVVPIVADVEGANLIVEDGRNGILFPHSKAGLRAALTAALEMSAEQWSVFSQAARNTIRDRYEIEVWGEKLLQEYKKLSSHL